LATGSLVQAFITFVTNDMSVTGAGLSGTFTDIGQTAIGGVTLGVGYATLLAFVLWVVTERTATGRRVYAVGFGPDASRLAGVRVERLQVGALLTSSLIAGLAGIVLASTLGSGSPTSGSPYLLPAFAAAFLGATQVRPGRFNAVGTVIAVLVLGTGTTGLALATAPTWAGNAFTGLVLVAALAATGVRERIGSLLRRRRERHDQGAVPGSGSADNG
jgi:ribose transport system permease protein